MDFKSHLIPMEDWLENMPIHGYDYLYNSCIMYFIMHREFHLCLMIAVSEVVLVFSLQGSSYLTPQTKWPTWGSAVFTRAGLHLMWLWHNVYKATLNCWGWQQRKKKPQLFHKLVKYFRWGSVFTCCRQLQIWMFGISLHNKHTFPAQPLATVWSAYWWCVSIYRGLKHNLRMVSEHLVGGCSNIQPGSCYMKQKVRWEKRKVIRHRNQRRKCAPITEHRKAASYHTAPAGLESCQHA